MFLEVLNHMLFDVSLLYFYIGILVLTLGVTYISQLMYRNMGPQQYDLKHEHQYGKINIAHVEKPFMTKEPFMDWLILICMRITEKNDKADSNPSYFNKYFKIRGGQICLETAYLQPLKNTV